MTPTSTLEPTTEAVGDPHRIFEPLHEEHDYVVEEIEGKLPAGPWRWPTIRTRTAPA